MTTKKLFGAIAAIALAVVLGGASNASAQTTSYTPPSGYSQYGGTGIYYNSSNGQYYNPTTGQYSNLIPSGSASMNPNGSYIIPSGYTSYGTNGQYYNSTTGYYYDPSTGFYSQSAPQNTGITSWQAMNPGMTNTSTGSTPTYPSGPATRDPVTGAYNNLPSGFSSYNDTGFYYNSSTGQYYDPSTGYYSTQAPTFQGSGSVTPGFPNTGAGGDAVTLFALLALAAAIAVGGTAYLTREA